MKPHFSILIFLVLFMPAVLWGQTYIDVQGGGMTYTMITEGEEIIHDIRVDDFVLSATEVTVNQWRKFTVDTGLNFPWEGHYAGDITELSPGNRCPIQLVKIEEALLFCNWKSRRDGLEEVYKQEGPRITRDPAANGYRLPTTEEWDYAARGGRKSNGYIYAGSNDPEEVAWFNLPFDEGTKPVGTKSPNELGLYDMTGNIREWTWPEKGIPFPTSGSDEMLHLRGGNWNIPTEFAALKFDRVVQVSLWSCVGFRLARNAD
jgi:formylglycine-generating enzyme required for sulfatase activity